MFLKRNTQKAKKKKMERTVLDFFTFLINFQSLKNSHLGQSSSTAIKHLLKHSSIVN